MRWMLFLMLMLPVVAVMAGGSKSTFEVDRFSSNAGEIKITCIGHGTLMIQFGEKVIHIDPVSEYVDYDSLPKADLILITHEHGDHLDVNAVQSLKKENTQILYTALCAKKLAGGQVLKNGESKTTAGVPILAVPAYNVIHKRQDGSPFHPKGNGNGYVLTLGDKKVYVAGDTELIPEMKNLPRIDIAFLPMNLPYTMTPEMVAEAARTIRPKILYPYHYGNTDVSRLQQLLAEDKNIEIRIRKLQ